MNDQDYEKQFEEFMNQPLSSDDSSLDYKNIEKEEISVSLTESHYEESSSLYSPAISKRSKFLKSIKKQQTNKDFNKSNEELDGTDNFAEEISHTDDKNEDICIEGEDTLEEKDDKEKFFKALEDGRSSPLNFSLLNKHLTDSGTLETVQKPLDDHLNQDSVMDSPKVKHQEETLKSKNDSDSDKNSSKRSRILEAINKMSLTSSTSNSLEINKSQTSYDLQTEVLQDIKSNVVSTNENDLKRPLESKYDNNLDDPNMLSIASSQEEVLNKIENEKELQRIEEDYFDLKNINQNNLLTEEMIGDSAIKVNDAIHSKLDELEAQIRHQDFIMKGYQKENEKKYRMSKQSKDKMDKDDDSARDNRLLQENFKLKNQIVTLREELNTLRSDVEAEKLQNIETVPPRMLELENELKLAHELNRKLGDKVNFLNMELKQKRNVPKSASLKNVTKKMSQTISISKIKPQRKSLIPTLAHGVKGSSSSSRKQNDHMIEYLEGKVTLLEDELRKKDENEDKRFRLLQSDFISVKMQYQDHLSLLEEQLKDKRTEVIKDGFCPDPNCRAKMNKYETDVSNLKKELQELKDSDKSSGSRLKEELERLRLEMESSKKLIRENFDLKLQISSLRNKYETDMKMIQSMHSNLVSNQEAKTRHLEESLRLSNSKLGELACLTKNCRELQMQVSKLKEELREAKRCHSPSLRHLEELNEKIHDMKAQLSRRDQHLSDFLATPNRNHQKDASFDLSIRELQIKHEEERNKWKNLVLEKINKIQYFRQQLDIVLDFVKKIKHGGNADSIDFGISIDALNKVIS